MYGETGAAMRTELAALLDQHRIQRRLGDTPDERAALGQVIQEFRHCVLVWCTQAMQVANPMLFSNLPVRVRDPFLTTEQGGAARELTRALEHAKTSATVQPASLAQLTTAHENDLVEHWRLAARAAALAEHDTTPRLAGRITSTQAQALVGDVATIAQALVILDKRYRALADWKSLPNSAQIGWSALASAIDANLKHPDYSVDNEGWRPRVKLLRGAVRPGILGVLQAEHNLWIRLHAFPHVANLRLVADSQRHISGHLAPHAARFDEALAGRWEVRAATYTLVREQLRDLGSLLGTGDHAAVEAATIVSRLNHVQPDTIVEPRILTALQTLYDKIDQRVADIVEEGLERRVFTQRATLKELETETGSLTAPVRERYHPIKCADDLDVVRTVREQLRTNTPPQPTYPDDSRARLHAALAHRRPTIGRATEAPGL